MKRLSRSVPTTKYSCFARRRLRITFLVAGPPAPVRSTRMGSATPNPLDGLFGNLEGTQPVDPSRERTESFPANGADEGSQLEYKGLRGASLQLDTTG